MVLQIRNKMEELIDGINKVIEDYNRSLTPKSEVVAELLDVIIIYLRKRG